MREARADALDRTFGWWRPPQANGAGAPVTSVSTEANPLPEGGLAPAVEGPLRD
jgi:hypothetical protein